MNFNTVAKNIIKETISSAIFIDDRALENFKSKNYKFKDDHDRTIALYNDFKNHQCLLHSFKYTKSGWRKNRQFYLKNKDLLILDWQLVGEDHLDALKILDEAVLEKSLHFVCIYTKEAKEVVKNELIRYFRGNVADEKLQEVRGLLDGTDLDDYWSYDYNHPEKEKLDTLINNIVNARKEDRGAEVEAFFDEYDTGAGGKEKIENLVPEDLTNSFLKLKTILSKEKGDFARSPENLFKTSGNDQYTFYINHTIVKIFTKEEIAGDQLYDAFLNSFLDNEQNIFLSLMGLEMRNRFRENSAFIGKDFDDLSEDAFFYHKNKNQSNSYIFIDFLREVLRDQVSSFLYEKELVLFDVLEEYYQANNGVANQRSFQSNGSKDRFIKELYTLNHFYNRLNVNERAKNDILRFGDIYRTVVEKPKDSGEVEKIVKYFLCVTPHCDCLNPHKIDNQYWFIEGLIAQNTQKAKMSVLDNTDGRFVSFVNINDKIEAIYWENSVHTCKPKSFYISNNRISNKKLSVAYNTRPLEFEFIETLRENYTQRLANRAFGYPLRVGIDFVKK